MKKVLVVLVLLLFVCSLSFAQAKRYRATVSLGQIVNQNKEELGITEKQLKKIDPIRNEARNSQREIIQKFRSQGPDAREAMQKEMKKNNERMDKKLEKILTRSQRSKAKKLKQQREEEIKKRIAQRSANR